jgi:hypothetical protein
VTLKLPAIYVAVIPLVIFTSGFGSSLFVRFSSGKINLQWAYFVGVAVAIFGCIWVFFASPTDKFYSKLVT